MLEIVLLLVALALVGFAGGFMAGFVYQYGKRMRLW